MTFKAIDLTHLYAPRGIAFVGASGNLENYNGRLLQYAIQSGFVGGLYPVNPKYQDVQGLPCFRTVSDIDGPVDVAVSLVGPHRISALYEELKQLGVKFLVVIGDLVAKDDPAGPDTLKKYLHDAANGGPRILGPDCAGYYSPHVPSAVGISSGLQIGPVPKGHIGVISQSGGVAGVLIDRGRHYGTGFSHIVATGRAVDIGLLDHLAFMVDDPLTHCISLCFEELEDYEGFFELTEKARAKGKPVIALKTGRTRESAAAMQSHSGRIVGPWDVQEAAFRRHGVVVAKTVDDMHIAATLLCNHRVDPNSGIAGASCSGGYSVLLADRIVDHDLKVSTLSAQTLERISSETGQQNPSNPVDAGAWGSIADDYKDVVNTLKALDDDPDVGATIYSELLFIGMDKILPELIAFHHACKKPHLTSLQTTAFPSKFVKALREAGCLVVDTPERALQAFRVLFDHARLNKPTAPKGMPPERLPDDITSPLTDKQLSTDQTEELLSRYNIPSPASGYATSVDEATEIAENLGFPVVLKGDMPGVAHKSELGLVQTGITDADDLRTRMSVMSATIGDKGRFKLQCQIQGGTEIMLGARIDPSIGAVVALNFGGIYAEAMGPPQMELAPFSTDIAKAMIERMDPKGILSGYRGQSEKDVNLLAQLIANFSMLIHNNRDTIEEIDLNPVIVTTHEAVAVDAMILTR